MTKTIILCILVEILSISVYMLSDLIPIDERVKRIIRFIILYICGVVLYKQCGLISIPVFFIVTALTLWLLKINFYHKVSKYMESEKAKEDDKDDDPE